jgi:GAF domain-containing protein
MSRNLPSLAFTLNAAPDLDATLVALGEALIEVDRGAVVGLLRYDPRREMLRERLTPSGGRVVATPVDTTFDHLPSAIRVAVSGGGPFVDLGERSSEYARLFGMTPYPDGGVLSLRGIRLEGMLSAVVALYEQRRMFGTRASERFAPAVALFELAYARLAEREAREEAVRTLEEVTQRVHGDYMRRLAELQDELERARDEANRDGGGPAAEQRVALERALSAAQEEARKATRRADAIEGHVSAAVGQLEQAHIELHRRSEMLRQKTRTLYLLERVLRLDTSAGDPRQLVDGLLALVGDDMQAQRCSLMLVAPEPGFLFLAASRGLAPGITEGSRVPIGEGVAGKVAATREPLVVQDAEHADEHPLLRDQHFTTGSFISFPLVYRGDLVGVVNLTNRQHRGLYAEHDVERVQLLALVISLIAANTSLPARLQEALDAR